MAKNTKKNAEDPAAPKATTTPQEQSGAAPKTAAKSSPKTAAKAASKKKTPPPQDSAAEASFAAGPAAAEDAASGAAEPVGPPVVSKKRAPAKKKKHDTDQPELNAVSAVPVPADAGIPQPADTNPAEIEALAQAADAFEEAYEERIPTQRRPSALEFAPPAASSIEIVSEDTSAELVSAPVTTPSETPAQTATQPQAARDNDEDLDSADLDSADLDADELDADELDEEDEDEDQDDDEDDELEDEDEEDLEDSEDDDLDDEDLENDDLDDDEEDSEGLGEADDSDEQPSAPRPEPNLQRLQKILSQAGIASRRHAEELITEGRVQVNGQIVTELGSKADAARDHIRVDGKLLHGAERLRYFMLNKPRGYVTTVSDPEGRPTVMEFVAKQGERLYPVGRLDYLSEGLLLMTNDGDLANKLTRAAAGVEKVYLVKVSGQPTEEELERLRSGVSIAKGKPGEGRVHTAPAQIRQVRQGDNPWYEVVLVEGRNRELRKMFEEIGHFVEKIRRVGYGPLVLDVEPGQIRELEPGELDLLRRAADGKWKPKPRPQPRRAETGSPRSEGGFQKPAFKERGKSGYSKGPGVKNSYAKGPGSKSSYGDRPPRREGSRSSGFGERPKARPDTRSGTRPQFGDRPPRPASERGSRSTDRPRFEDRGVQSRGPSRPPRSGAFRPGGEAPSEDFRARRAPAGSSAPRPGASEGRSSGRNFPPREGGVRGSSAGRDRDTNRGSGRGFAGKRAPATGGRTFRDAADRSSSSDRGGDTRRTGFGPRAGQNGRFEGSQNRRSPGDRSGAENRRPSAPRDRRDDYPEPSDRPNTERLHIEELGEQTPRTERPASRTPRPGGYAGRGGSQGSTRPQGTRSGPGTERGENRGFSDRPRPAGDRPRTGGDRPRPSGDRPRSGSGASGRPQGRPGFKGAGKSFGGPPRKSSGSRSPSSGRRPGAPGGGRGNNRGPSRGRS